MQVNGLSQLRAAMLQLPKEMDQRILGSSLLAGAVIVREEAKRLAPELKVPSRYRLAGVLKRNIRMARSKPRQGMTATVVIGVRKLSKSIVRKFKQAAYRRGKTIKGADIIGNPFYWRFMEFGYTDRGGNWHGPHGGQGFLRPAFAAKTDASIRSITAATKKNIDRAAKKLGFTVK